MAFGSEEWRKKQDEKLAKAIAKHAARVEKARKAVEAANKRKETANKKKADGIAEAKKTRFTSKRNPKKKR